MPHRQSRIKNHGKPWFFIGIADESRRGALRGNVAGETGAAVVANLKTLLSPSKMVTSAFSVWVSGNWRMTFKFDGLDAVLVDYQDYH